MSRRVLVTGGSEFIRTNLVESLVQDRITIVNLDHPRLRRDHGPYRERTDLLEPEAVARLLRQFHPEQVISRSSRRRIRATNKEQPCSITVMR